MTLELLQILMYLVVGAAIVMYVVLDGFDLGVGALHLFARKDEDRRIFLNSIGPLWDGNEVWLIIIGGALFVGFPDAFGAVFSGFYTLFMVFLCGIIFRAVAIEFRSKHQSSRWRSTWDTMFGLSSVVMIFGSGIILGNLIIGVPIDASREIFWPFWDLFKPYPIAIGIFAIFLFVLHGNHFLLMKTEGDLQEKIYSWTPWTTSIFIVSFIGITLWTWFGYPFMVTRFMEYPIFMLVPLAMALSIISMVVFTAKKRHGWSFFCTMTTITILFVLFAIGTFPNVVTSSLTPVFDLTLYNASSSYTTLVVALIITLIGLPFVFGYGWLIYHIFRGKTKLHEHSY